MTKRSGLLYRSFAWTVVLTTLFVLTLGAVLISYVVGDWIFWKTENSVLSGFLGGVVLMGFLATLGSGIGFWLWTRSPKIGMTPGADPVDTMEIILADMQERD